MLLPTHTELLVQGVFTQIQNRCLHKYNSFLIEVVFKKIVLSMLISSDPWNKGGKQTISTCMWMHLLYNNLDLRILFSCFFFFLYSLRQSLWISCARTPLELCLPVQKLLRTGSVSWITQPKVLSFFFDDCFHFIAFITTVCPLKTQNSTHIVGYFIKRSKKEQRKLGMGFSR